MLTVNNNTKINYLLEALPLDVATKVGDIIAEAIEVANSDWNSWDEEKIGDLTIKEFEDVLVGLIDARDLNEEDFHADTEDQNLIRFYRFDEIMRKKTFRETIVID